MAALAILILESLAWGSKAAGATLQEVPSASVRLSGEVELARLVDLSAQRLGFDVDYDTALLKGTVTLRLAEGLDDTALWELTNQILATRDLASVIQPGSRLVSIVRLADAPVRARLERPDLPQIPAGFSVLVTRVQHREVADVLEPVRQVLSKPAGLIAPLGDGGLVLIADLKPRIEQAIYVLTLVDVPSGVPAIEILPAINLRASDLATLVTSAVAARDEVVGKRLRGRVMAIPDGSAVLVTAPGSEIGTWSDLVRRLDQRQEVQTRSYNMRTLAARDVGTLIEQACRDAGPRGAGDQWKVVLDEFTGTLIVTATPGEHEAIADLVERLEASTSGERRRVRAFVIRNRPVADVISVFSSFVDAGVIEVQDVNGSDRLSTMGSDAGQFAAAASQRTEREPRSAGAGELTQSSGPGTRLQSRRPAAARSARVVGSAALAFTADEGTNTLLVIGEPRLVTQVEDMLRTIDVRQPQVMLEALVVTLTDDQTVELGVELEKISISGSTIITLASLFSLTPPPGVMPPPARPQGFTGTVLNPGDFSVVIRALEKLNKGRALNLPKLLVNNNEIATINSVLQQPVLTTNASTTVATTSFGGTQDAGTTVTIRPQIAEGDHLVLEYSVSISAFVGTSSDPSLPPPRQQNTLESIVTIPDGYTVAVGGLRIDSDLDGRSQVPLVGDIPLIGELFKSRSSADKQQRFFVFLRANVLRSPAFEDLRYLSDLDQADAGIPGDFPASEPRLIR
ncbi:MAG TPA: secretin N-terminal domain-containing protein [Phycisphaerales bacterium]|nr:secretin N-terminal domain-containing protein [Phycisphaerales bacterium]HMP37805.1 secretin N-terminal domain-containing protein [Phycisphaerales bacterium]